MAGSGILIVDFGTSSVRAFVFDAESGAQLGFAMRRYLQEYVNPVIMELDPEMLWCKSEAAVESVVNDLRPGIHLVGLCFSFFGDNVMAVDSKGNPLTNLIMCTDERGDFEAMYIDRRLGPLHQELTGEMCSNACCSAKILWIRNHMPDVFEKTAKFWNIQQYILSKLGFGDQCDYTMASRLVLFDNRQRRWAQPILEAIGIAPDYLCDTVDTRSVIGETSRYGKISLECKIPVVIGGHDVALGVIGVGICEARRHVLANVTGTYESMCFLSETCRTPGVNGDGIAFCSYCAPVPDMMLCVADNGPMGMKLEKFLYQVYGNTIRSSYDDLWKNSFAAAPGARIADPNVLQFSKYESFEALIHRMNRTAQNAIRLCERETGAKCESVRAGGGFARSSTWMQLRADCFGIPVERIDCDDISALGAAVIAAEALGFYDTLKQAADAMVHVKDLFLPAAADN